MTDVMQSFLVVFGSSALILCACGTPPSSTTSEPEPSPRGDRSGGDQAAGERAGDSRSAKIWAPDEGDHLWVAPESPDELGSGGEFHIYLDPDIDPVARASFAKYALGVGGALPEHRHAKTEEIAYFVSGEGVVRVYENGEAQEVAVGPGYVWYNPPGAWHGVTNTGDEPLVLAFATIPNEKQGLLSFFRRIGVEPGEQPTPLPPDEFARIAAEHDLILKPPPRAEQE